MDRRVESGGALVGARGRAPPRPRFPILKVRLAIIVRMAIGTDYLLDALIREGISHLFMVPGGLVDPFLPALGRFPALKPIIAAQEGGAAFMADGYARAGGRFGVALGIGGPGLGNMITAMATALTDGSKVFVMSGEVAIAMEGLGQFQDASAETFNDPVLAAPVTRFSTSVDSAMNLNH